MSHYTLIPRMQTCMNQRTRPVDVASSPPSYSVARRDFNSSGMWGDHLSFCRRFSMMHTHLALGRRFVPSDSRHVEAPGSMAVYVLSARSALISWLILSLLAVIDSRLTQFHHHSVRARRVAFSHGRNCSDTSLFRPPSMSEP